jgi:KaiC/GvpD/RAD55 family RecA-like ATPase
MNAYDGMSPEEIALACGIDDVPIGDEPPKGKTKVTTDRFRWIDRRNDPGITLNGLWIIKSLIPANALAVIFGQPGSGKSFLSLDIAMHIAFSMPWRGLLQKNPGSVSYISSEAGGGGTNRIHSWLIHHDRKWPAGFRQSPVMLDLRSTDDDARLLIADIRKNQPDCRVLVIDTLSRNLAGGNENSPEDMGAFVRMVSLIKEAIGCTVIVVHHSGKDEARGSRGHSCLLGALDLEIEVKRERQPGAIGQMTVTKMRDGVDGAVFNFQLEGVLLGKDEDGHDVWGAVAVDAETPEKTSSKLKANGQARIALKALEEAIADHGQSPPPSTLLDRTKRVVREDLWRQACERVQITETDKPDSKAKAFKRAAVKLQEEGFIGKFEEWIWINQ